MRCRSLILLSLAWLLCSIAAAQRTEWTVGAIEGLDKFAILTPQEKLMDSLTLTNFMDSQTRMLKNRSRALLTETWADTALNKYNPVNPEPTPMRCFCAVQGDSISLSSGAGFFGGISVELMITGNTFAISFTEYIDDVDIYKHELSDSAWAKIINVKAAEQTLVLTEKPTWNRGDILTGRLTFTTVPYYQILAKPEAKVIGGEMIFTCQLR